jgi:formate dehydrogenase subunit gamma
VKRLLSVLALCAALLLAMGPVRAQSTIPEPSRNPGTSADMWRDVRQGIRGYVSIPDKQAGVLVQSEGELWRNWRNGRVSTWGSWLLLGVVVVLAIFFALRGRIRVESGLSGRTIERFNALERGIHWLTATSFILLALTGLVVLYGRYVLLPVLGPSAFAGLAQFSKFVHNYIGIAFIVGIVLTFIVWVRWNLPDRCDLEWLKQGGGLFKKHTHPPSRKFNAGQKLLFWSVVVFGAALSVTGVMLLFPLYWADLQQMQTAQLVHAALALFMIAVIIAHIYIGTIGMEGAFDAMGTGRVDINWAIEHHDLWVEEMRQRRAAQQQPAE